MARPMAARRFGESRRKTRRVPSFFKVLVDDNFSIQMKIPPAFYKHFDGKVPKQSLLWTPSRTWNVDVQKVNDRLVFQKGWREFAHDNGLEFGEFLVFHYAGNSEFYVEIFGRNACKRGLGMDIGHSIDRPLEEGHDNLVNSPRSKYGGCFTRHGKHNVDGQSLKASSAAGTSTRQATTPIKEEVIVIDSETSESEASQSETSDSETSESETSKSEASECETSEPETSMHIDEPETDQLSGDSGIGLPRDQLGSRKDLPLKVSHARALEAAHKYSSGIQYPSFISVLLTAYVHKGMLHVAKSFMKQLGRRNNVKLQVSKRLWTVKCVHDPNSTKLSAGWFKFVKDHALKMGDVCVFELIKKGDGLIKVSFFRC